MRLDAQLQFVPNGVPQSMVGGGGVAIPFTTVIDLMGVGVGVAPPNIIGNAALFGQDWGPGNSYGTPGLETVIGTAFVTANAATANFQIQAAPDTGLAGGYQPGAYQTLVETGALTAAQLTANAIAARFTWPLAFPVTLRPRFVRMQMVVPAATNFSAGTILFSGVVWMRDDQANKQAAANYTVQ